MEWFSLTEEVIEGFMGKISEMNFRKFLTWRRGRKTIQEEL